MTTTKAKRSTKKPSPDVGRKVLSVTFGVLESAGKRLARFAHEGQKKYSADGHKTEHKTVRKAS